MPQQRWVQWLIILLSLILISTGVGWLLRGQGMAMGGTVVMWTGAAATYLWLVGGVFAFAQPRWLIWTLLHLAIALVGAGIGFSFFLMGAAGAGLVLLGVAHVFRGALVYHSYETRPTRRAVAVGLLACADVAGFCLICRHFDYPGTAIVVLGTLCMILAFGLGLWLIRMMLMPGVPALGVARTLIDEAMRMKIALIFVVVIMLVVPVLPYTFDPDDPNELLKYRLGTFLAWSLWATAIALALMTIFLSCATICGELRNRQIFLTMTKPIGRAQYLAGKWLGIALLNLLLVSVAGGGIYMFARIMERMEDRGLYDRLAVTDEVLTARISILPTPSRGVSVNDLVRERIAENAARKMYGMSGNPSDKEAQETLNQVVNKWHTIPRLESQTYVFSGLAAVSKKGGAVQLKLKPAADDRVPSDLIHITIEVNDRVMPYSVYGGLSLNTAHVLSIPTEMIDEQGNLEIRIINKHPISEKLTQDSTISFTPDEGLNLLYHYGDFGPNLGRAILIIWVQLCFLSMVGLTAGTFLGFPVACLLSLMVYSTALLSGYMTEAFVGYAVSVAEDASTWDLIVKYPATFWDKLVERKVWDAIKVLIQLLGQIFVALVPSFSTYNPMPLVADGQAVMPTLLGRALLMIGLIWNGVTALIGYFIFRRRELARVTV